MGREKRLNLKKIRTLEGDLKSLRAQLKAEKAKRKNGELSRSRSYEREVPTMEKIGCKNNDGGGSGGESMKSRANVLAPIGGNPVNVSRKKEREIPSINKIGCENKDARGSGR